MNKWVKHKFINQQCKYRLPIISKRPSSTYHVWMKSVRSPKVHLNPLVIELTVTTDNYNSWAVLSACASAFNITVGDI